MDVPEAIKRLIRTEAYLLTHKAQKGLVEDGFTQDDLEHAILNGEVNKTITDSTGESRRVYVIVGPAQTGTRLYTQGRIVIRESRTYLIISAHKPRR